MVTPSNLVDLISIYTYIAFVLLFARLHIQDKYQVR